MAFTSARWFTLSSLKIKPGCSLAAGFFSKPLVIITGEVGKVCLEENPVAATWRWAWDVEVSDSLTSWGLEMELQLPPASTLSPNLWSQTPAGRFLYTKGEMNNQDFSSPQPFFLSQRALVSACKNGWGVVYCVCPTSFGRVLCVESKCWLKALSAVSI